MNGRSSQPEQLWSPPNPGRTSMDEYRRHVNEKYNQDLKTSSELHRWSVQSPHEFWIDLYSWIGLVPALEPGTKKAYDDTVPMSSNPPWFPGLQMNYAENALFSNPNDDAVALIGLRDYTDLTSSDGATLTWRQLREEVRRTASALRRCGVRKGDRVAARESKIVECNGLLANFILLSSRGDIDRGNDSIPRKCEHSGNFHVRELSRTRHPLTSFPQMYQPRLRSRGVCVSPGPSHPEDCFRRLSYGLQGPSSLNDSQDR